MNSSLREASYKDARSREPLQMLFGFVEEVLGRFH